MDDPNPQEPLMSASEVDDHDPVKPKRGANPDVEDYGRVQMAVAGGDIPLHRRASITMDDIAIDPKEETSSICFNCTYPGCFNWCCKDYRIRVYMHYWVWQVLMLCLNIALIVLYALEVVSIDTGFLGVLFIFCAILIRDKQFCWILYGFVKKSRYYTCARQCRYHLTRLADGIGGLHSSCGVSALVWNSIYFYDNQITFGKMNVTWFLPFALLTMIVFALPCIREHYHNTFELIHRYFRWIAIGLLLYSHIVIGEVYKSSIGVFVLLILIFLLTVYPWLIQHKISGADVTVVSASMATAYFFPIKCPMGAVAKISTNGLEYHVMGITPLGTDEKTGKPKSLALIKSLGDWTTKLNDDTRDEAKLRDMTFYIARVKPPNFTQGLFNWDRVFILVTGVGIAPCIPYVTNDISGLGLAVSLLWVARDHANNYPKFIIDILEPIPNMELYDTTKKKRPNLCSLVVKKARAFDAQAVFIVSGADMASRIGNYVHAQGIPVFASNFDT
eukprot:350963_1